MTPAALPAVAEGLRPRADSAPAPPAPAPSMPPRPEPSLLAAALSPPRPEAWRSESPRPDAWAGRAPRPSMAHSSALAMDVFMDASFPRQPAGSIQGLKLARRAAQTCARLQTFARARSEERRVGKECRSRW